MKKKSLIVLGLTAIMSLSLPILAHAKQWEKQADGSYKGWDEDKNLNEDSGYYNVHNYRWEQQADGTWKVYYTHDYWKLLCNCSLGHLSDPKYTCPGRLEHTEEWVTGRQNINEVYYLFDENGTMVTNQWIPYESSFRSNSLTYTETKYSDAVYVYYAESGAKLRDRVVDGKYIDKAGFYYDPSIIPIGSDGRFDLAKMDWTSEIYHLVKDKIICDFTKEEIIDAFKKLPEYARETTNEYGVVEIYFSDYQIQNSFNNLMVAFRASELYGGGGSYYKTKYL